MRSWISQTDVSGYLSFTQRFTLPALVDVENVRKVESRCPRATSTQTATCVAREFSTMTRIAATLGGARQCLQEAVPTVAIAAHGYP